jgi:hypothetical protein
MSFYFLLVSQMFHFSSFSCSVLLYIFVTSSHTHLIFSLISFRYLCFLFLSFWIIRFNPPPPLHFFNLTLPHVLFLFLPFLLSHYSIFCCYISVSAIICPFAHGACRRCVHYCRH